MKRSVGIALFSALLFCLAANDRLPEPTVIKPDGVQYVRPLISADTAQYQNFSWKAIRHARKYEVAVQSKTAANTWTPAETLTVKTNSAEVWLMPGKYRFAVTVFNFLNRKVSTSEWIEFTVLPENEPYIFDKLFDFDDAFNSKVLRFNRDMPATEQTLTIKGRNIFYTGTTFVFIPLEDSETGGKSFRRMTVESPSVPCKIIGRDMKDNTVTVSFDSTRLFAGYYRLQALNPGGETHSTEILALVNRPPSISGSGFDFNERYNVHSMEIKVPIQFAAALPQPDPPPALADDEPESANESVRTAGESETANEPEAVANQPGLQTAPDSDTRNTAAEATDTPLPDAAENAIAAPPAVADIRPIVISGTDFVPGMTFSLIPDDSVAYPFASTAARTVLQPERVELRPSDGSTSSVALYFDVLQIRTGFYRLTAETALTGTCELPLLFTVAAEAEDTPAVTNVKSILNTETNTLNVELEGINLNSEYSYSMVSFCMPDNRNIHLPMTVTQDDNGMQKLSLSVDASLIPAVGTYTIFVESGAAATNLFVALRSNLSMRLMDLPPEEVERVFLEPVDMTVDTDGNKWIFDMPMDSDRWYGWFADKWRPSGSPDGILENEKYFALNDDTEIKTARLRNKVLERHEDEWGTTGFGIDDSDSILKTGDTVIFKLQAPHRQIMWKISLRQVKDGKTSYFVHSLPVPRGTSIVEIPYGEFTYDPVRGGAGGALDPAFLAGIEFTRNVDSRYNSSGSITVSEIKVYDSAKCTEFRRETQHVPVSFTALTVQLGGTVDMWRSIGGLFGNSLPQLDVGAELRLADFSRVSADAALRYNAATNSPAADITARARFPHKLVSPYIGFGAGYLWNAGASGLYVPFFAGITAFDRLDLRYTGTLVNAGRFFGGAENADVAHSFSMGLSFPLRTPYTEKSPLLSSGISGIGDIAAPVIQPPFLSTLMIRYGGTVVHSNLFDVNSTDDIWSFGVRVYDYRWAAFDATLSLDKIASSQSVDFDITGVLIYPSNTLSPYAGMGIGFSGNTGGASDSGTYIPLFCGLTFLNYIDCRYTCQISDAFGSPGFRHLYSIGVSIKHRKPYRATLKKIEPFVTKSADSTDGIEHADAVADKDYRSEHEKAKTE